MAHTPGPWYFGKLLHWAGETNYYRIRPKGHPDDPSTPIANVWEPKHDSPFYLAALANARLIAAAPELLEACVKAESFDWKSGEGAWDVYETLRAAIAKAKG